MEEHNTGFDVIVPVVQERLAQNERIRRNLPGDGRLRIDRQLPFLCVHRAPADGVDTETRKLITTEAAYLFTTAQDSLFGGLVRLCRAIGNMMQEHFGVFLIVEVWTEETFEVESWRPLRPRFRIETTETEPLPTAVETLRKALATIELDSCSASVDVAVRDTPIAPPGLPSLHAELSCSGWFYLGLAIAPVFRNRETGDVYPMVLQALRRQLAPALRRMFAAFAGVQKDGARWHFESVGPSSLVKASRLVDQQLCEVAASFDFILQATPVNADQAWREFWEGGCRKAPLLHYRPLPYHPSLLKRQLFEIPVERTEDATLTHLFLEKQDELDRQLTALRSLDTPVFRYCSLQLYGGVEEELLETAETLLAAIPPPEGAVDPQARIPARELAARAREEIDYYHQQFPGFAARVEIRDDIAAGMMVARDCLLISESMTVRPHRVSPLLHHEVGTHLLTYFNGQGQQLRQLYAGLAGYETLQEGLAVLAEFLVGGLTPSRLRTLAARVVAVRSMLEGRSFVDTFQLLHEEHHFSAERAFRTTLRVYRGGGLTKDAIYLRGFNALLKYLCEGHEVEPLYVGKISLEHVPYMQELRRRGIVHPPSLLPRFWIENTGLRDRLSRCAGQSFLEVLELRP